MFGWFNRKTPQCKLPEEVKSLVETRLTTRKPISEPRFRQLWTLVLSPQTQNVILPVEELEQLLDHILAYEAESNFCGSSYPGYWVSSGLFRCVMADREEQIIDSDVPNPQVSVDPKPNQDEIRQILEALDKKVNS